MVRIARSLRLKYFHLKNMKDESTGSLVRSGMTTRNFCLLWWMDTSKVLQAFWSFVAVAFLLCPVSVQGQGSLSIVFKETPTNTTSRTNATFRFDVVGADGVNSCARQKCSVRCKLDQSAFEDCNAQASFVNLRDGGHIFYVSVNESSGAFITSEFKWIVDTGPPTAVVDGGAAFTHAVNVTVNITFSETCDHGGGFVCTNTSFCDLLVYGAGAVIPSTFVELEKGRVYSIVIELAPEAPRGRVNVVIAKRACADAAGNFFQRTDNSTFVIHFDRTVPTVNLWTALPTSEVLIDNQPRTIEATNKVSDLILYLDFAEPIIGSADTLLGQLNASSGSLSATHRKSYANRRFGYVLSNITDVTVVTVTLPGNSVASRYGTLFAETSTTFLYDTERPQVQLSTTSLAKTKNHFVPVLVQFTEPVFGFASSGVTVSGGTLTRPVHEKNPDCFYWHLDFTVVNFKEVSKNTYALEVYVVDNNLVTVAVPENCSLDAAGNSNVASSILQVRHYTTPAASVALYYLTTAGLLSTAFVSGALSISSGTLAAAGTLLGQRSVSIGADPSRNLLGMACHLQILAFSDWLAVSLPIEYHEVTRGLRWLIPHVKTPWQDDSGYNTATDSGSGVEIYVPTILQSLIRGRRRLLEETGSSGQPIGHRGRMLGANTTLYGPAFGADDYKLYFLNQKTYMQALKNAVNKNDDVGWQDFQKNMFWLAVVGGGFILLHLLMLFYLRWRTKTPQRGALAIPRFELFILILALPGMCQASAFIIKGDTTVGIVVGGLLLAVPAAFLASVIIFLIYGIYLGALVRYKEFRQPEDRRDGNLQITQHQGLLVVLTGTGYPGKWVRKSHLGYTFLPRYGLLFEDRKGPPKIIIPETLPNHTNSDHRADSTTWSVNSDDDISNEVVISSFAQILGGAQAAYFLVDLSRRITLGLVFGAYTRSDHSWSQVSIVLGSTVIQLLYVVITKPFRSRGVQLVETISLLCEVGIFGAAIALLVKGDPTKNHLEVGIVMLVFLLISFVAQLVNEWYALMEQLMRLSTVGQPSLKEGLKRLAGGIILPLIPRRTWSRLIGPQLQPESGTVGVKSSHPDQRREANATTHERAKHATTKEIGPAASTITDARIPIHHFGTPSFIGPHSIVQGKLENDGDSGPPSGELRAEASPRSLSHWSNKRSVEGKRSRGSSRDGKSEELKMLRELAKASFPRRRQDEEFGIHPGMITGIGGSGTPLENSSPVASPRGGSIRYVRRRRQFPGLPQRSMEGNTDDSLSEVTSEGDIVRDDHPSLPETSNVGDLATVATSSSRSNNKGSGHSESHSLNLREPGSAIRPLEER